jgi:hypothetical protein
MFNYVCVYVCVCVRVYVCMYVRMYVCIAFADAKVPWKLSKWEEIVQSAKEVVEALAWCWFYPYFFDFPSSLHTQSPAPEINSFSLASHYHVPSHHVSNMALSR